MTVCKKCRTSNGRIVMLPCSGASNLGQLANQAGVQLAREGFAAMSCLAAIGAHLDPFLRSAKEAGTLVAIDGCAVGCAKKVLEHADLPPDSYIVVSELGIAKNMDTILNTEDVVRVKAAVRAVCGGSEMTEPVVAGKPTTCCG